MKVSFYVGPDGEVLSNKAHPVESRLLCIPNSPLGGPIPCEAVSELMITENMIGLHVYKAVTMDVPDDYFAAKDGIIR